MKIGDKVKVIRLDAVDREDTNMEIGDIGIIVRGSSHSNVLDIMFENELDILDDWNVEEDGAYAMYRDQLEVVTK